MPALRRSTRERKPVVKITDDASDRELSDLRESPSHPARREKRKVLDQEFAEDEPESIDTDSDGVVSAADSGTKSKKNKVRRADVKTKRNVRVPVNKVELRSRGQPLVHLNVGGNAGRWETVSGGVEEDMPAILSSIQNWAHDAVLPHRSTLHHPFVHSDTTIDREAATGWTWYESDKKAEYARTQKSTILSEKSGEAYFLPQSKAPHKVLLGPYRAQALHNLESGQSLNVDTAFPPGATADGPASTPQTCRGWVFNAGARIRCLDWATGTDLQSQTLAVVTKSTHAPNLPNIAPAFNPAPGFPSTIQIWNFDTTTVSLPDKLTPYLRQILCHDWGDAKQIKWCPMPRAYPQDNTAVQDQLGLLAGIFDDGSARIIDHDLIHSPSTATHPTFINLLTAAVTIPPRRNTILTCLCWLSASSVALGYSNGYMATYSLSQSRFKHESRLHQTYILSLTTCYPTCPDLILSSSLSGHTGLASLIRTDANAMLSRRSHIPASTVAFHPALLGTIAPDDSKESLTYTSLRNWGSEVSIADNNGMGGVGPGAGILDVGKVHACIAWGTNDGRVLVTNPVSKVMRGSKERAWQITVFKHEWNDGRYACREGLDERTEQDAGAAPELAGENVDMSSIKEETDGGISRILEGFRAQAIEFKNGVNNAMPVVKGVGPITTIYEEQTGTTAVAWNPNIQYGTWLAAGWGTGLIRVQDVGL